MNLKIKLVAFFALALLSIKSYSQSITVTPAIQQQSNSFKSLAGQDRKAEFEQLKAVIKTESQKMCNPKAATWQPTTKADVIKLLGSPDIEKDVNNFSYKIGINKKFGQVTFKINSAGQILHYSLTDIL